MPVGAGRDIVRCDVLRSCLGKEGVSGVTAAMPGERLDIDAVLCSRRGVAAGCVWRDMVVSVTGLCPWQECVQVLV